MKFLCLFPIVLLALWLYFDSDCARAGSQLPTPRSVDDDDNPRFSIADFNRSLQELKSQREGLHSDWQSLIKRNARPSQDVDHDVTEQLKLILQYLQKRNSASPPAVGPERPQTPPQPNKEIPQPQPVEPAKNPSVDTDKPAGAAPAGASASSQAHALFRSGQFEDALASFRLIDLKGQKAEVRTPVEYLMAMCLVHLGKNEEALPLFREVANARGDARLAGHAQWYLEMLRWHRDVQERLQQFRQRREVLEKRS